ncbi:hypothetical protein ADK76_21105 [Streptomyces griseoflavus]|nr:hypothetical protein ADK76_21105 [Streptomyces griseoflavus]
MATAADLLARNSRSAEWGAGFDILCDQPEPGGANLSRGSQPPYVPGMLETAESARAVLCGAQPTSWGE